MNALLHLTLTELAKKLRTREVSASETLDACLAQVRATEGQISAYVRVLEDDARAAAKQAEADIAAGHWKGPLHGVPIAVKDLYDIAGVPTTASSRQREQWIPKQDSAVVARLKAAGAVIVGKTHTHEFAYGAITPNSRNPWDLTRITGGSSGGSAATVAACGAFMAMGTDTGGSIRIPSSICGTAGIKPTFGRVSRAGVTSLSWALDHAGPIARSVEDLAISLQAIAGFDANDRGSLDAPVPDYRQDLHDGIKGLRVGVPVNFFFDRIDPEVASAVRAACKRLEALGAVLVQAEIPMAEQIIPVEFGIMLPEASAYHRQMLRETPERYTEDVRLLLELGELIPATDYIQAQRVRTLMQQAVAHMYEHIDVLVAPTLPIPAALASDQAKTWPDGVAEPLVMAYTRYTSFGDIMGLPTLNLPCGFTQGGLPIGMQIHGRPLDEKTVLRVGFAYEQATDWHTRHPELAAA